MTDVDPSSLPGVDEALSISVIVERLNFLSETDMHSSVIARQTFAEAARLLAVKPKDCATDLHTVIRESLGNHRLHHQRDDENGGLPLVDALSCGGPTIAKGLEELELLTDAIWNDVCMALTTDAATDTGAPEEKE